MIKVGRKSNEAKYNAEEAAALSLEEIKKMIEVEMPGAFTKKQKKPAAKKKAAPKKKK